MNETNKCDGQLTPHQMILKELWTVFDSICRKHNIQYMLFAGTALGAVRDKGIIPWDDDFDVVMLRPEYIKFMDVVSEELDHSKYYMQKEFSRHWPMFFSKLRKNDTACIERYIPKDHQMHQGIYIDIFPSDNLSDIVFVRKLQFVASKIIIAKSLGTRGYATNNIAKRVMIAGSCLVKGTLLMRLIQLSNNTGTKYVHTFLGGARKYKKNIYPRNWFEDIVEVPFEDSVAPISKHYDQLLKKIYGDYMTPLPESQRGCKVHADIVDTENSYEKYIDEQCKRVIKEYTRSIR